MELQQGDTLLSQFELIQKHQSFGQMGDNSEAWLAHMIEDGTDDEYGSESNSFVLFASPISDDADDVQLFKYLLAKQVKTMHLLESLPNGTEHFLVADKYGEDSHHGCFVFAYRSELALMPLSQQLKDGFFTDYIKGAKRDRKDVWLSLLELAKGIDLLHKNKIVHKSISLKNIITGDEPLLFRLSGLSNISRLEQDGTNRMATDYADNKVWQTFLNQRYQELGLKGHSYTTDWIDFATVVYSLLVSPRPPKKRQDLRIQRSELEPDEKQLLEMLLLNPEAKLSGRQIINRIQTIHESADAGIIFQRQTELSIFTLRNSSEQQIDYLEDQGLIEEGEDDAARERYFSLFLDELIEQTEQVYVACISNEKLVLRFTVSEKGMRQHVYFKLIQKIVDRRHGLKNWSDAALQEITLIKPRISGDWLDISDKYQLKVVRLIPKNHEKQGWNPVVDALDNFNSAETYTLNKERQFRSFLSVSNQLEILLRYGQIYRFVVTRLEVKVEGLEKQVMLTIEEAPEDEDSLRSLARSFFKGGKSLLDNLSHEFSISKESTVYLGGHGDGKLALSKSAQQLESMQWEQSKLVIGSRDEPGRASFLKRIHLNDPLPFNEGDSGYIRTSGHHGQNKLLERRHQSIQNLDNHRLLVKTMALKGSRTAKEDFEWIYHQPDMTGTDIDKSGQQRISNILQKAPMYTLQGPPGSGKSTIVANLIKVILNHNPMTQIMITAKDHSAVNVLMNKIDALYQDDTSKKPLSLKLEGAVVSDSKLSEMLQSSAEAPVNVQAAQGLQAIPELTNSIIDLLGVRQKHKHEKVNASAASPRVLRNISGLKDLMRRAATLIFATTSAKDLVSFADNRQKFDWVIVEEAGKTHGFDLALPLQTGYRWLLVGDQAQLRPFLYEEFKEALSFNNRQSDVSPAQLLKELSEENQIRDYDEEAFKVVAEMNEANLHTYLETFRYLFEQRNRDNQQNALADTLDLQRRMPKKIGDLISRIFYDNKLRTLEEHAYYSAHLNPIQKPALLAGEDKSISWISLPLGATGMEDMSPDSGYGIVNYKEVSLIRQIITEMEVNSPSSIAVLSPYVKQVELINAENIPLPEGLSKVTVRRKGDTSHEQMAYTADSFQGDEADIIILSLVGNNSVESHERLRFILEKHRLNVMLSRARKKLIIVGCFNYFLKNRSSLDTKSKLFIDLFDSELSGERFPLNTNVTPAIFLQGER